MRRFQNTFSGTITAPQYTFDLILAPNQAFEMDFVRLVVNAVLTGGFIAIVTTANTFALVRLSPGSSGVSQTFTRPIFVAGGQIVRLTTTNQLAPTPLNYYIDLAGFY